MAAKSESNEETNKAIKYFKKAVSQLKALKLPSTHTQSQSKPQCFAICIDHLGPIQIPSFYIPPQGSNGKIEIKLHCSIFDSNQLCFVGRTWKSKPFATNATNQALPINKFWIYLKSVPYEAKWTVIEVAAQIRSEGVIISQISLGWRVIQLFANTRALVDVHADENNNDPLQRESKLKSAFLFHGSPTYLLMNKDIDSIPESAIKLSFRLFTFKKLINIAHLLSSETIIGSNDIIPGLGHTVNIPHTPYQQAWNHVLHMKPVDFIVSSPTLTLPDAFEVDILEKLSKIRKNNFCGSDQSSAKIVDRRLNISFYNGRNIITTPTVIQLQTNAMSSNTLSWSGDVKIRVYANLDHCCWLLLSLNYHIEWKDNPLCAQSPSHHRTVCLGRDLVNITSNKLVLNGKQSIELALSSNFGWIDDCALFNHNTNNDKKQDICASFTMRLASVTDSVTQQINTSNNRSKAPQLSTMHHVSTFHTNEAPQISTVKSNVTIASSNQILASPQGYIAMNWDDIKQQTLMIPTNVLQHNMNSTKRLALLQESFAVDTWQKMQLHSTKSSGAAKILKHSQSIRSLRGGYVTFDFSPFDTMPNRKCVDIETELHLSHKRRFVLACNALNVKCKHLLLHQKMESIMIQLDFMGEKQMSSVIKLAANHTIDHLRESIMDEDKYETLVFDEAQVFEFNITPKQIRQFIHFLNEKYAIFTVFNANTRFQIGSSRICLRDYLLQNNIDETSLKENIEIPISLTKVTKNPSCIIETQPNMSLTDCNTIMNGKLCIEIIHETIDLSDTAKLQYVHWSKNLITNTCDEDGVFCVRDLKLMHSNNTRIRAEALYKNAQCTQKLQNVSYHPQNASYPTQHHITTKWNIPIEAIHEVSNHEDFGKTSPLIRSQSNRRYLHDEQWKLRRENIEIMNDFRDRKKHEMLHKLSDSEQFIIQPSMGQIIFFEIEFVNPWNERKAFTISINDEIQSAELQLVTNVKEISYLKQKYNVSTTMKRHLFEKMNSNQITLNAQEKVFIPFKFQSFAINPCIQKRIIYVSIQDEDDSSVIEFNISVEPLLFGVDRIFDVFSFVENSKFVCHLPLPSIQNIHTTNDEHMISVECSDNNTAFELDANHENITVRVDNKAEQNTFYFIVYNDKYFVDIINEIWEINIHSYLHQNGHGMLGGIIKNNIHLSSAVLRAHCNENKIEFHCDQQHGMQLELKHTKNETKEEEWCLNIEFAPTQIGKQLMRIHGVNDASRVIYSCLLIMHIEMPPINNSFMIHIAEDDNSNKCGDGVVTRKLPYYNGYNQERDYELVSNDPSVIRVTNPMLKIPPQSTMEFVLEIMPQNMSSSGIYSKEVLLFVTECGNLEQCLRIEVKKGKLTNL